MLKEGDRVTLTLDGDTSGRGKQAAQPQKD